MEALYGSPALNIEIFAYWEKWKKSSQSFKAIDKEDRKKLDDIIKDLAELEKNMDNSDINYNKIAELYLSMASDLIHLKWKKKDPKNRVDINLKCDSLFNKIYLAFKTLTDLLKTNINTYTEDQLQSEALLELQEEQLKISILSKIFYEYSVALNSGGELEE